MVKHKVVSVDSIEGAQQAILWADRVAQIYKNAPIGLCYIDRDLRYVHINDWLAELNGISAAAHVGRRIEEILPEVAEGINEQLRQVIETGEPIIGASIKASTPAYPGSPHVFQHNFFPVISDDGVVEGVNAVVEDITERKKAEAALHDANEAIAKANKDLDLKVRQQTRKFRDANRQLKAEIAEREHLHKRFEALLEAAPDATISVDRAGKIIQVNKQVEAVLGYKRDELIGQSVETIIPDRFKAEHNDHLRNYSKNPMPRSMGSEMDLTALCKDGHELPVEISLSPVFDFENEVVIASIRDMTERRRDMQALRYLSARLIDAQEEERSRIARDLHDDFSQELALMAIGLGRLDEELPKSDAKLYQTVQDLLARNQKIANGLHDLSHSLHPSSIKHLGLEKAVESYCATFSDQHDLRIEFTHNTVPGTIPGDIALCLYRIIQEAIQNVLKYSGADEARIDITGNKTSLRLRISDFGIGFDPEQVRGKGGLGLVSMQERLRLVGGRLSIESEEAKGTRLDIQVPLVQDEVAQDEVVLDKAK